LSNLQHLDLPGISAKLDTLLARLNTTLSELNLPEISAGVTNLLGAANQFIRGPDLTNTVKAARLALDRTQALLARIDGRVDPLADSVTNTLADAQKTLADLRRGLQNLSGTLGPEASFRFDLSQALEQLGNASRAVADLAEFLQRNPDALITGRKAPKE
jgi:paraquat-inducible protein B